MIAQDTDALEKRLVLAGFVGCKTAISPTGDAMVPPAALGCFGVGLWENICQLIEHLSYENLSDIIMCKPA